MSGSLRTPLARVRGHGAAKSGTSHFIAQRTTAIANLLLAPYLVARAALTLEPGYVGAQMWLANPLNAVPLAVFLVIALYHMRLGMQVVIEDYVAKPFSKLALLVLNTLLVIALGAAGLYALLAITLGV